MLSDKQVKLLKLLDKQIQSCTKCNLHKTGRCKPYWTPESKYVIVLEAPGADEVKKNTPVVGKAGDKLWEIADHFSLPRKSFLIINAVNCRPVQPGTDRNGKPTKDQIGICREWVRKYIKVLCPEKGIVMGGYSLFTIFGQEGIMKSNSTVEFNNEFQCNFVKSIHPAMCIYSGDKGKSMLFRSFESFVKMEERDKEENNNTDIFF